MNYFVSSFDVYLMSRERLADLTRKAYIKDVSLFFTFLAERRIPLEGLKMGAISEFHKYMYHKGFKARTRARKVLALKRFFIFLHKEHNYPNWSIYIQTPPFEKNLPNILNKDEVMKFLKATALGYKDNKLRDQLMIFLLYGCGLRVSELITLRKRDIFLNDCVLRVFGKGSRERLIPIPFLCIELIEKYFQKIPIEDDDYLFATKYKGQTRNMTRQNVTLIINEIWKRTGIKKRMYPHLIRHTFASHMMNNGANIRQIQALLGHERLSSTQVYTHLTLERIKKSYDSLHIRA